MAMKRYQIVSFDTTILSDHRENEQDFNIHFDKFKFNECQKGYD